MVILKIKEICTFKGISQKALAEKVGVSATSLSRIVTGEQKPSLDTLDKIASALGVSVAELFEAPLADSAVITCPHCGNPITLQVEK